MKFPQLQIFEIILSSRREFESRQRLGIFLFATASRPSLGPPNLLSNGYQGFFPWE